MDKNIRYNNQTLDLGEVGTFKILLILSAFMYWAVSTSFLTCFNVVTHGLSNFYIG